MVDIANELFQQTFPEDDPSRTPTLRQNKSLWRLPPLCIDYKRSPEE